MTGNGAAPIVEVREIVKRFGPLSVLAGISLSVARGEVVVICGRSGSGKSTLLRCINGLETIDGGEIRLDGAPVDMSAAGLQSVRRRVGMVFQSFNLFPHLTIRQNLILAPVKVLGLSRADAEARAMRLLERVGIHEKADAFPDMLSGGQQQRVAIARALCMEPEVLLFDEPTSALDPAMIHEVLDVMRNLARDGTTMIVVTHEMAFAREAADRVAFVDAGRIVEEAAPAEFFDRPRQEPTRQFLRTILTH
jgi:ABC-type polar amino acid transport system ATPase subunit